MERIDDLKEILSAIQEIGTSWQKEIIKLREENAQLADENKILRDNYDQLHAENESLKQELCNLSEKMEQLNLNLRNEIFKELNDMKQDEFQKMVADYLREIRKQVSSESENKTAEQQKSHLEYDGERVKTVNTEESGRPY